MIIATQLRRGEISRRMASERASEHAFVGAGEGPCVILMVGSRSGTEVHYPVSELAARYGASVAEETSDWRQAYASVEWFRRKHPPTWARLPWA